MGDALDQNIHPSHEIPEGHHQGIAQLNLEVPLIQIRRQLNFQHIFESICVYFSITIAGIQRDFEVEGNVSFKKIGIKLSDNQLKCTKLNSH